MRLLRIAAIVLGIALAIAVAAPLLLLAVGIRVDVSAFAAQMAPLASESMGREVSIDGPVYVVPSYWPTLEVHGLHLADPFGEPGSEFASLGQARIVLSLMPIVLQGKLRIEEISAEAVRVNLVRYRNGDASWAFDMGSGSEAPAEVEATPDAPAEDAEEEEREVAFRELEELSFRDVEVHYLDESSGERVDLVVDECLGAAAENEPIRLSMEGHYQSEPFFLRVGAGHLADLLSARPELPLDLELGIAGSALEIGLDLEDAAEGPDEDAVRFAEAAGRYWLRFESEELTRLGAIAGIDLPPLGPIRLRAHAELTPSHWKLTELKLQVGETTLAGTADLEDDPEAPRPRASFDLTAQRFRIDDFQAEGWSLATGSEAAEPTDEEPEVTPPARDDEAPQVLVDPEVMRRLDARLSISVDDVLLGDESLGGGELVAELKDGRFELAPVTVRIPGGSFAMAAAFEPTESDVHGRFDFQVEAFDLGVLARRAQPESEMGGRLDVDFEIESRAPDAQRLMQRANGHIDLSLVPVNLEAGTIDLWAVNLLAAVLPVVASGESHVNCVVGLFDLADGVLTTHSLLIDTTRIQVSGVARADFETQEVEAMLQPRPKKPQFFSLGTPVQVSGSFADFGVGVSAADLAGTVVRVVTDLATFPLRLFFTKRVSADGAEACAAARDRSTPVD